MPRPALGTRVCSLRVGCAASGAGSVITAAGTGCGHGGSGEQQQGGHGRGRDKSHGNLRDALAAKLGIGVGRNNRSLADIFAGTRATAARRFRLISGLGPGG